MSCRRDLVFKYVTLIGLLSAQTLNAQSFPEIAAQANAAREADRLPEAAALYRKALALNSAWAEGWFSLGTIQYDQDAYQEAAASLTHAVELAPENGPALLMLGLSECELGRNEPALRHLQEGQRARISAGASLRKVGLFHQAVLLQRAAKFEAAETTLYPLCRDGIQSQELLQTLGMVALRIEQESPPASVPVAQVGHAEWLADQRNFEAAHREYDFLVQEFPDLPNIHLAYGRFLLKVHDFTGAVAQFENEIKRHPGSVIARLEIAAVKYRVDSAAGLPYAEEAVILDPTSPFARYLLGLLLVDTGDCRRAIPELESAKKSLTEEPGVFYALGNAYARCGRSDDAARARATFNNLRNQGNSSSFVEVP